MKTISTHVALYVVDPSAEAAATWLDALSEASSSGPQCMTSMPADIEQLFGGLWLVAIDDGCSPGEIDRMLQVVCSPTSQHRFIVLIDDPEEMPDVSGTVWLPRDASMPEVRRWVAWMTRTVSESHAMNLAMQCPIDTLNPVIGFDRRGDLSFANPPAQELLERSLADGRSVLEYLAESLDTLDAFMPTSELVVELDAQLYAFRFVHDHGSRTTLGYGFDITAFGGILPTHSEDDARNRNKDAFLRSMSHELRTPLNAVLACTEAMREGVYGDFDAMQLEAVQSIRTSGKHLLTLINDVLDVSKIEAGCLELDAFPTGVESLCDSVVQIVGNNADNKDISLSLSVDADSQVIHADPLRVRQILINLLGNAIKFTPDGGSVGLEVSRQSQGDQLVFRVWDTGPGISSEYAQTIFDPFVQAQEGRKPGRVGSGLGLGLARQLAELHGGHVEVQRFDGPGTVIDLVLPVGEEGPVLQEDPLATSEWFLAESQPIEEGEMDKVLIAEDTDSNFQHTRDLLVSLGYEVERAHNGREAVDSCQARCPDVVLMDIDMPVMNGLDAIRLLRQDDRTRDVPIIAVTAVANIVDARACMKAGASAYLAKPFALRSLMSTMSSVVA